MCALVLGKGRSGFDEVLTILEETMEKFAMQVPDIMREFIHVHQGSLTYDETCTRGKRPSLHDIWFVRGGTSQTMFIYDHVYKDC